MSDSCCGPQWGAGTTEPVSAPSPIGRARTTDGQVMVPGGTFAMGDAFGEGYHADGESPVHQVTLPDFWIDAHAVTNAAFADFVAATGHVTDAEELGISAVFHLAYAGAPAHVLHALAAAPWWLAVRGADWSHPEGPDSGIDERLDHPVVHVSWRDAAAFAAWSGKRLATEAEWEYAARGGLSGKRFAWGDELLVDGAWQCNIWQGEFPRTNTEEDGYLTTAPVGSFSANGYGLHQTSGNVWEWCADWFEPSYYQHSPQDSPTGPAAGHSKVIRGGSYLCHDSYCHRYRVAARSHNTPDSATANMGFRCGNDA